MVTYEKNPFKIIISPEKKSIICHHLKAITHKTLPVYKNYKYFE
jgi:hypothetical protein